MSGIDQRYLVLETWNGETFISIEYGDRKRTREKIRQGECRRIEISPEGPRTCYELLLAGKL